VEVIKGRIVYSSVKARALSLRLPSYAFSISFSWPQ
jgi:hypothetical protein